MMRSAVHQVLRSARCSQVQPRLAASRVLGSTRRLSDSAGTSTSTGTSTGDAERKWSTRLAKQLGDAISATGPIPLASFMRMCLTSDIGGYYTGAIQEGRDQFGLKGDFVTSPEISQVFGELIGIWFLTEWLAQGRPSQGVELIEVGPGRGTLMHDMLRTIHSFKGMSDAIDAIYMVEASAELRIAQKNLLCGEDAPMNESKVGFHSVSKVNSIPIVWTETIKSIPRSPDKTPFIVAHEFFDALPIHAFQCVEVPPSPDTPSSTSKRPTSPGTESSAPELQWRELLVSPTPPGSTHQSIGTPRTQSHDTPPPDFQMTLAKAATRHSLYLPESSSRYRSIKTHTGAGALLEVCPDASLYAADFAARIGGSPQHPKPRPKGAALILDYGPGDGSVPTNSLRGIRLHKRVSPFAEPGLTDLSADVDFAAVADACVRASEGVEVHGPIEQATFLEVMGIRERAEMLVKAARDRGGEQGEERAASVDKAWKRLVDRGPNGMGKVYKALAILPENDGRRRPVGFGGDVAA